ncbi:MAG: hypothetical protein HYX34_08040 [Actinobacteria bacterium]|nr:hypothetical protein [Actinomycetota bacterium]
MQARCMRITLAAVVLGALAGSGCAQGVRSVSAIGASERSQSPGTEVASGGRGGRSGPSGPASTAPPPSTTRSTIPLTTFPRIIDEPSPTTAPPDDLPPAPGEPEAVALLRKVGPRQQSLTTYSFTVAQEVSLGGAPRAMLSKSTGETDVARRLSKLDISIVGAGQRRTISMVRVEGGTWTTGIPTSDSRPWVRCEVPPVVVSDASGFVGVLALPNVGAALKGTEVLQGVRTTRITGRTTLGRAVEAIPETVAGYLRRAMQSLPDGGSSPFSFQAWVDDTGLLRRLRYSFSIAGASLSSTYEAFDFGKPVSVSPPPPDQVSADPCPGGGGGLGLPPGIPG